MDWIIDAKAIKKSFNETIVLQHVDLQVLKGEVIAIMGKSGSGKSTLLHILGTLDNMDHGTLTIDGKNPALLNKDQLAEFRNTHIGFVFQFHHLLAEFSLEENISIPGYIKGTNKIKIKSRAQLLLDYFGLTRVSSQKPKQLSGGEQQRAAICRALFNEPSVLLADEPTGNLDQQNAEEFHQLIRKLSTDFNQTFIIVTHQADLAAQCDKIYHLESGKLVLQ